MSLYSTEFPRNEFLTNYDLILSSGGGLSITTQGKDSDCFSLQGKGIFDLGFGVFIVYFCLFINSCTKLYDFRILYVVFWFILCKGRARNNVKHFTINSFVNLSTVAVTFFLFRNICFSSSTCFEDLNIIFNIY